MIKVLVTGANGQLGRCIEKIHNNYENISFVFTTSSELDITKKNGVAELFQKNNFDFCINCAAYTNVEQAEKEPVKAFAINAEGVKNLAETCKLHEVILIHISTDYVFDGEKRTPYTVDDTPNPINEYGKSKLKGEQYIQQILDKFFIIRTSWLYSEFGNNFYKIILKKAKEESVLYITDEQTGAPTDANNLAKFILNKLVKNNTLYGIHHFTDGKSMSWYEFAEKIIAENGLNNSLIAQKYSTFAKRPKYSVLQKDHRL